MSLFPQYIDIFTPKVDETGDGNGDYILAEHINLIQNAITSIEGALGTNPQGSSLNVAQRLYELDQNKTLTIPKIILHKGNPKQVNGVTSINEAARIFNYFSIVLLDDLDPYADAITDTQDTMETTKAIGNTYFYAGMDAGVSTVNLDLALIEGTIGRWKDIGVDGIYFKNFGYDCLVSRERQNALVAIAHSKGMRVLVSATSIDDVFGTENTNGMNPNIEEMDLLSSDGYVSLGYATTGEYYQNGAELASISQKMVSYRSAYGVSMYAIGYLSEVSKEERAKKYYYGQSVAMAYSLNGYHVIDTDIQPTIELFRTFPITGNYYEAEPVIKRTGNVITRVGHIGTITIDLDAHTYDFANIKIPLRFIDMTADDTTIDAGKLSGTIEDSVSINVIGRINADSTLAKISADKIELNGEDIIDAINIVKDSVAHKISKSAIEDLNSTDIEGLVVEALGRQLDDMLLTQNYDANFDRLTASVVSSLNAYFEKIKAGTVETNGLNAGIVNTGSLNTDIIQANTLTSDKFTIHGNSGLNKWTGVIVPKAAGVQANPNASHINGMDVYRKVEALDATGISTSGIVGSSLQNYVVKWETNVYCTDTFPFSRNLHANSDTNLYINGTLIAHCGPNQTVPYGQVVLQPGWNLIQVFQDHNAETSCSFDIGVKFSDFSLQTEKGTDTHVARVDAYASQSTQIIGDLLKTGTVNAAKIEAHTITGEQIEAHSLTAEQIEAGSITAAEIDVNDLNAAIVDADLLNVIEARVQRLTATDGEFGRVLTDMLTSKFVNANNIRITSEAQDTSNTTGLLTGNTGTLTIDNGGIIVAQTKKGKIDVVSKPMTTTFPRVYKTEYKPILDTPTPVFVLKDRTTGEITSLLKEDGTKRYRIIYEYGQITVDDDVSLVNKDILATYSYPETWFPDHTLVVKIDKEGLHISNDGGRPQSWITKLDGNRLWVRSADIEYLAVQTAHIDNGAITTVKIGDAQITNAKIASIDAGKITTGTLTASESVTVSAGSGAVVLDERGLIATNFSIGTDGNVTLTGTLTAQTGSKIANWNIGANTIYDNANKIVLDSSVPSITVDTDKAILGLYDGVHYGIKAIQGQIGNVLIDNDGLVIGEGSIVDTRDTSTQKLHISKAGVIAGNISATTGTINGIQITPTGLQAFTIHETIHESPVTNVVQYITENTQLVENNEYITNNYYLQPDAIRVRGNESVIIDTGNLVVKDGLGVNRIILGKLTDAYGFKLNMDSGKYIQLDPLGMRVWDGIRNTININSAGDVTITGTINAEKGTLGTLTVNGTITGPGYSIDQTGITTTAGAIGGWVIDDYAITSPNIHLESDKELITIASEVLIGKYDQVTPKYGIQAGGTILDGSGLTMNEGSITLGTTFSVNNEGELTSLKGTIAGWTIDTNSIRKGTFILDAQNSKLDLGTGKIVLNADGSAVIGNLRVANTGAITSTNFTIEADGDVTIAGLTATNGSFSGTINATSGWFGTSTNHVTISGNGLQAGSVAITDAGIKVGTVVEISGAGLIIKDTATGNSSITLGDATEDKFIVTSGGILTAKAGTVGGWTLGNTTLTGGRVTLDSTGKIIISNGTSDVIKLGLYDVGKYGMLVTKGTDTTFEVSNDGSVKVKGNITADTGTLGDLDVTGNINVGTAIDIDGANGKITVNNTQVVLDNTGIKAIAGSIGGWTLASDKLTGGSVELYSTGKIAIGSTKVVFNNDGSGNIGQIKFTSDGQFYAGTDLASYKFKIDTSGNAYFKGDVTATTGVIGGWDIGANTISKNNVTLNSTGSIKLGSSDQVVLSAATGIAVSTDQFTVSLAGAMVAKAATITGTITATGGKIGGWDINNDINKTLSSSNDKIILDPTAETITTTGVTIGKYDSTVGAEKYGVKAGNTILDANGIKADQGTVGGWTLAAGEISNGNIHLDKTNNAIWIGSALASAVIRLNSTGTSNIGKFTIATNGAISTGNGFDIGTDGTFSATAGTIAGWTVLSTTLSDAATVVSSRLVLDKTNQYIAVKSTDTYEEVRLGKKGTSYGLHLNAADATTSPRMTLDQNGLIFQRYVTTAWTDMFYLKKDGSAYFAGQLAASTGKIGNWTIGTNTLTAGTLTLDATAGSEKIKVAKTGDATKYVQIDGTGLNVVGGIINIVTGTTNLVKIDGTGITAGGASQYANLSDTGLKIVGGAVDIQTAVSGSNKLEIKSTGIIATADANNRVEINGTGVRVIKNGTDIGAAITSEGIIGTLLTNQSVSGSKFDKVAPDAPTGVAATQVIEQTATSEFINIQVSWSAVTTNNDTGHTACDDLAGYKVYLKEGSLYMPQAVVQKDQTSYVIRNVKGATQYYVAVSAYDVTGNESARSADKAITTSKDGIAPANVTGLSYVDGPKMFYVKWNPVTTNADAGNTVCVDLDYYELQRKTEQLGAVVEDWTLINRTYSTGIIDKDVAYEYDYSYRVRAVDLSGNTSAAWATVSAGKPSKIGAADIVAGSITADVLNVGAMVKGINPNKTILFHYDGVMTSTQDLRPVAFSGGAWVDGKYGNAIALEEATMNLVSEATGGNAGFNNGVTGWTNSGAVYNANGGIKGSDDGYAAVTDAGKISITLNTVSGKQYAVSVFAKLDDFTKPANVIVKANGAEIMNTALISEWKRVFYIYTANSATTTFEFCSSNANVVCIDSVQVEQRGFITAFTESYEIAEGSTRTGIRPEGIIKYSAEKLNPKSGIIAIWYRPNRVNGSPNTSGQILFIWGTDPNNYYKLEITNDNKPKWTMVSQGTTRTMIHQSVVDAMAWNQITIRWSYDPTVSNKYAQLFLNGTPVEDNNRIDLSAFPTPNLGATYFTLGNHHDKGYSCNGYLDEIRIDIESLMDDQEREEIISWYKQGSTFYDVASQIDADSQGISASNARIRINSEGITVNDGVIKVVAEDGVTLIGGGRLNVNGINVGVVQSDNEVYNGNFSAKDTLLGTGDMYVDNSGVQFYGAAYWRSRRSSGPTYGNALLQSAWNKHLVNSLMDFGFVRNMIYDTFNTQYRANEAMNHTIENNILPVMYAQGIAGVTATSTAVGATSIKTTTLVWQPGMTIYVGSGANREAATIVNIVPGAPHTISFAVGLTKTHDIGEFIVEKTLFDDTLEDELAYQIDKATNSKYDEWINFGVSTVRYNDANGLNFAAAVRFDSTSNTLQYIKHQWDPWARRLSIPTSEIDPVTMLPKVYEATEAQGVYGHTIFEVHPVEVLYGKTGYVKLGVDTMNKDYTFDASLQKVSIEQNLNNLITYTDGLKPNETHWKQQVFTAYTKWNDKPIGSQAKLRFEVDELVPNFTVDEQGVAVVKPTFEMSTPSTVVDQNTFLLSNTDFVAQTYQAIIGNATLSSDHKQYTLNNVRYASALPVMKVRYIRDWVNGSTTNAGNHWSNITVVNTLGQPVAIDPSKIISSSSFNTSYPAASMVDIDGSYQPNLATYAQVDGTTGPQYVQIDLGSVMNLVQITIHHYFADGRTYHGTRTQVSEDGYKWFDVYNSIYQGEYAETIQGHTIGGMLNQTTPNPIFVQEVLTELGETQQPGWVIKSDGGSITGMPDSKYLASTTTGDTLIMYFNTDSNSDIRLNMVKNTGCGTVSVFIDGIFFGEVDVSYVANVLYSMDSKNMPAGQHMIVAIATGAPGANTAQGTTHPAFMMESTQWFTWNLVNTTDYTSLVEYEEVDPTGWNKIVIRPNKTNDKGSGVPLIQAEMVPIKYRVRIELEKPEGDPFPVSAYVTGIQAEAGFNESFSRVNYGPADGMPAAILQNYNREIPLSGIAPSKLQEHVPEFIWETGIQERHLANYQITTVKMAPGAVTANVIASGNITYDKMAWKKNILLQMNVSSSDYPYPVILPYNFDTKVRYIPEEIAEESQEVFLNGQLQFPGEDYTIERVIAAQHIDPSTTPPTTIEEYAYKITFQHDIPANARVWANYFLPVL